MIQAKVCLIGAFAVGKTSLVQRFVRSIFSEKYHTTVGVKIDKKHVSVGDEAVNLMLWDLAGEDEFQSVRTTYLRGSSGLLFVADGTRRTTLDQVRSLRDLTGDHLGDVPAVLALNKVDLKDQWELAADTVSDFSSRGWHVFETSAKSGDGVEHAFRQLAGEILARR